MAGCSCAGRMLFRLWNPPFGGAKYQSETQRAQVRGIARLGGSGGTLDFVCAWFLKAGAYVRTSKARIGFVATNSITQGEQVAQLWPLLFDRYGLEIAFAHRTFAWGSDARGMAHVHVVIIWSTKREDEPKEKRLFSYDDIKGDPVESRHAALSPYLFDASTLGNRHLVVEETGRPINGAPRLITGTQPLENDHLTFDDSQKAEFVRAEPASKKLFHPFPGAQEFIHGQSRWILHTADIDPERLRKMPHVVERLVAVKRFRRKSRRASTLAIAEFPSRYGVTVVPISPFLILPQVSSERREICSNWRGLHHRQFRVKSCAYY